MIFFPESNRWVHMEEPAWYVYSLYEGGEEESAITGRLIRRYGLPAPEARRFAVEVTGTIEEYSRSSELPLPQYREAPDLLRYRPARRLSRRYLMNRIPVTISYGSPLAEYYIHRPLAHLETAGHTEKGVLFEVFEYGNDNSPFGDEKESGRRADPGGKAKTGNGETKSRNSPGGNEEKRYILRFVRSREANPNAGAKACGREQTIETGLNTGRLSPQSDGHLCLSFDDPGLLKRELYLELANLMYNKSADDWMATIHASAITNGREAILLSSASGSGKSTMAALLQSPAMYHPGSPLFPGCHDSNGSPSVKREHPGPPAGLWFMSDDFVPVDTQEKKAHTFPAALTIKEGSFDALSPLYDPRDDADAGYRGLKNRSVRYLRPRFPDKGNYNPKPVKKIIFIRYNPEIPFEMEKLSTLRALALFHEEAWVSHDAGHAQGFIDWFVSLDCYRLEYSENRRAVKFINELIEKE